MQPLEDPENQVRVTWVDTDTVVLHREQPIAPLFYSRYPYFRNSVRMILDRVADQVLKNLLQVDGSHLDSRQRIGVNLRAGL